jgi:hypothetical protein
VLNVSSSTEAPVTYIHNIHKYSILLLHIGSYPISEGISSSLLWMCSQVLGLVILIVLDALRNSDGTYTRALIFATCICLPLTLLSTIYNAPNKRLEYEKNRINNNS